MVSVKVMRSKRIATVFGVTMAVIAIVIFAGMRYFRNNPQILTKGRSFLEIENYVFTKVGSGNEAVLRIYGLNKSNKAVNNFPVVVEYYSKTGEYLGEDVADLLLETKTMLKAYGKMNAQVSITYPEGTQKILLSVDDK